MDDKHTPKDVFGKAVKTGDRVAYPSRRGSVTLLKTLIVGGVNYAETPPKIFGTSPTGRKTGFNSSYFAIEGK